MAIDINSLGLEELKRLFKTLGISMTNDVIHYLAVKERVRCQRIAKSKTNAQKKIQLKHKFEQWSEYEAAKAKKERANREGTYNTSLA
jgi:hypothetical protein